MQTTIFLVPCSFHLQWVCSKLQKGKGDKQTKKTTSDKCKNNYNEICKENNS